LSGMISLRQHSDRRAAVQSFKKTIYQADARLAVSAEHFAALDAKGLAFSGLALCGSTDYLPEAIAAYRKARAITHDDGIRRRVLRQLEELSQEDPADLLAQVRQAAAGE
jgi:hypothetical protein